MEMKFLVRLAIAPTLALACADEAGRFSGTPRDDLVAVSRLLVTLDRIAAEEDLEELLALVAEDAVLMPPAEPAVVGMRGIGEWFRDLYDRVDIEVRHEPLEVDAAGPFLIHRGNASGTLTPKGGGPPTGFDLKYMFVLRKRANGSLELWRAIYSSNAKPTGID